jgi:anaerobic selenocysteine-containing dehydrogenase
MAAHFVRQGKVSLYSLTEHWCGGGETRNVPSLLEAEPQLYVEMSPELAGEKGIKNGDPVVVESARGRVEAVAMVTIRIRARLSMRLECPSLPAGQHRVWVMRQIVCA